MDAPKCRICGTKHWARQVCPGHEPRTVTKNVTPAKPVTKPVTGCPSCPALIERIAELLIELAKAKGAKKAQTSAERVRKHRAARKAKGKPDRPIPYPSASD